jgi:hypothetical protein
MAKKPRKPPPPVLLSIDATPETAKLDGLLTAKDALMARDEADKRHVVSFQQAMKMLDVGDTKLGELLDDGLVVGVKYGTSHKSPRKVIVHSIYMFQIRLIDMEIEKLLEDMDRRGIPGAEEWLNPSRKA